MQKTGKRHNPKHNMYALLVLVVCAISCNESKTNESCQPYENRYRLSEGGYSHSASTLVFVVDAFDGDTPNNSSLWSYNEKTEEFQLLMVSAPVPQTIEWVPDGDAFAVAHGSRMSIFEPNAGKSEYEGTAISHPLDFMYLRCSWNTTGDLLAVQCRDLKDGSQTLGLYSRGKNKFTVTDIDYTSYPGWERPFWTDATTVYIPNENEETIVEVNVSDHPRMTRTIPIQGGTSFYAMLNGLPLVQCGKKLLIGNTIVEELDEEDARSRVMVTDERIFVLASPKHLGVFDHKGKKLDDISLQTAICFGSVDRVGNAAYALDGTKLLRIGFENKKLSMRTVCDLKDWQQSIGVSRGQGSVGVSP